MDDYISFSQLNDFLYSPFSLYLHECYKTYNKKVYHDTPQTMGTHAHETIDNHQYKKKNWITGMWLSSPTLRIYGKLDLYNEITGELVERKRLIKNIYDGYKMQVWAQYYCLKEMGYEVSTIALHSLTDNTRYSLGIPTSEDIQKLKKLILEINTYHPEFEELTNPENKSLISIYAPLCPKGEE
jgi:CRISPR-associated protein Cas4